MSAFNAANFKTAKAEPLHLVVTTSGRKINVRKTRAGQKGYTIIMKIPNDIPRLPEFNSDEFQQYVTCDHQVTEREYGKVNEWFTTFKQWRDLEIVRGLRNHVEPSERDIDPNNTALHIDNLNGLESSMHAIADAIDIIEASDEPGLDPVEAMHLFQAWHRIANRLIKLGYEQKYFEHNHWRIHDETALDALTKKRRINNDSNLHEYAPYLTKFHITSKRDLVQQETTTQHRKRCPKAARDKTE